MLVYTEGKIEQVAVHQIGNKTNDESLILSKENLDLSDPLLTDVLFKFCLPHFKHPEFFNFTFSNKDFRLNPLYTYCKSIFEQGNTFHKNTINIAKHLYEVSIHPNVKSGDLFVVQFNDLVLEDELVNAIGIFKSEDKHHFLKVEKGADDLYLDCDSGINIEKLDKGCLVFELEEEQGYRVCIVDKSNKGTEAQYWRDHFLQLIPCEDDYHHTTTYLNVAKAFVKEQIQEEFEIEKADQIGLLNRSVAYFKNNETFDNAEFESEVFQDENVIKSFQNYKENYGENQDIPMNDFFDISKEALKRNERGFKSVLKLDKNFHVYIHGDRKLIERGTEPDGRKYYKIYYNEEQ